MDLHGNLGPEVIEAADVVTGYHSSPHVDMAETGRRAARILLAAMQGRVRPVMAFAKPGVMLPSIFTATALRPLADIKRQAADWQAREEGLLDVSVFCGFAYADTPDTGMSVIAVADGDEDLARRAAADLTCRSNAASTASGCSSASWSTASRTGWRRRRRSKAPRSACWSMRTG